MISYSSLLQQMVRLWWWIVQYIRYLRSRSYICKLYLQML
jgi:hypothetical protein